MNPFHYDQLSHEDRVRLYRRIINSYGTTITAGHYDLLHSGAPTPEDRAALSEAWDILCSEIV